MNKLKWSNNSIMGNSILNNGKGIVFLSYQPNELFGGGELDSENPETAIVLEGDKENGMNRYLIFRGDKRKELEKLYPNVNKLKEYWKKEGGHFFSDSLDN